VQIGNTSLDTPGTLGNLGPTALGAYLVKIYNLEAGSAKGKAFIEDFKAKIGHYPYSEEPTSVFALMLLGEGLKTVDFKGGDIDATRLVLAIEQARWESPIGTWSVRKEDHQAAMPITISEVSRKAMYKVDNTDMGFHLVRVVTPEQAAVPVAAACSMQRPR
jgi:branched-chain amino acid transport system substrate-binding protein